MSKLFDKLLKINVWWLLPMAILISEVFTLILSEIFSLIFWKTHVTRDIFFIGLFDGGIVSLLVVGIVIYFLQNTKVLKRRNDEMTEEIIFRKILEKKLKRLAEIDGLTTVYNRLYFQEKQIEINKHEYMPIAIIMFDLNGLKLTNDAFGHKKGDEVLQEVAKCLQRETPENGSVYRVGGDEFVLLITNTTLEQANEVRNRIQKTTNESRVDFIPISISSGLAIKNSVEEDFWYVFKEAEDKMYQRKMYESRDQKNSMIKIIMETLHIKNKREKDHSDRVANLCKLIAKAANFSQEKQDEMYIAGLLHDIGKVTIDETILNKSGRLNLEEWEIMKSHPENGYRILSSVVNLSQISEYVLYHHERIDGKGYPQGLKNDEIPIESRIIAIADAYDAMTSLRPYRETMSKNQAIDEIKKNIGTQFDKNLASKFVEHLENE